MRLIDKHELLRRVPYSLMHIGRLAREHLFPSAEYMRTMYAPYSSAPLSFLYTVRLVRGALKWIGI